MEVPEPEPSDYSEELSTQFIAATRDMNLLTVLRTRGGGGFFVGPEIDLYSFTIPCTEDDFDGLDGFLDSRTGNVRKLRLPTPQDDSLLIFQPPDLWAPSLLPNALRGNLIDNTPCLGFNPQPIGRPIKAENGLLLLGEFDGEPIYAAGVRDPRNRLTVQIRSVNQTITGAFVLGQMVPTMQLTSEGAFGLFNTQQNSIELLTFEVSTSSIGLRRIATYTPSGSSENLAFATLPGNRFLASETDRLVYLNGGNVQVSLILEPTANNCFLPIDRLHVATNPFLAAYIISQTDIFVWNPSTFSFHKESVPEDFRGNCDYRALATESGLVIANTGGARIRTMDGNWDTFPAHPNATENEPVSAPLVLVGNQATLTATPELPSGRRFFRSIYCGAGLEDWVGYRVVSYLPDGDTTYVALRDLSDPTSYQIISLTQPDDPSYRRCWNTPLVPALDEE